MPEKVWLESLAVPYDHFPLQSGLETRCKPRHLCLRASVPPIVWCNSRWGWRSVALQHEKYRLWPISASWRFLFFPSVTPPPHLSSPSGLNIYGLVKPKWNQELTNISSVKVLSEKALNLHHYSSSSGEMVGLIQTIYTQLEGREAKQKEACFMSVQPFIVCRVGASWCSTTPRHLEVTQCSVVVLKTVILRQRKDTGLW